MKTTILILVQTCLVFFTAVAQRSGNFLGRDTDMSHLEEIFSPKDPATHPYRRIRGIQGPVVNLTPLFDWQKKPRANRGAQPLPQWITLRARVGNVLPDGLIVYRKGWDRDLQQAVYNTPYYLRNYPNFSSCIEGQELLFTALQEGNYPHTTRYDVRTIAALDYGLVPTAAEWAQARKNIAAASTKTNSVQTNAVMTNFVQTDVVQTNAAGRQP